MVVVTVDQHEGAGYLDRSGSVGDCGREGFVVAIGGAELRFEDEADAVALARRILDRMGETHP